MIRQKSFEDKRPILYLVPTPIGNLSEMTTRALDVLKDVDVIAAEDTRNSRKLMNAYEIHTPLISHHEHNQATSIPKILEYLVSGNNVAVISDAGYPLVSDPGQRLVQECIKNGYAVVSVSGANAATNALVASGLSTSHYLFYGFLENKSSKRKKELSDLANIPYTLIFYEAPHRIVDMLSDVLDVLGDRRMCLARELTKLHEEYIRGNVSEVLEVAGDCKGEMVVIIEGHENKKEAVDLDLALSMIDNYVSSGIRTKEAISKVAKETGQSKNALYDLYHKSRSDIQSF